MINFKYFSIFFVLLLVVGFVSAYNGDVCNETNRPCDGTCTSTDLTGMFQNIVGFDSVVGDITTWNTSCVTSMAQLFSSSDFNQDISGWDVSQVTDMNSMFLTTPFDQNIGSWDVSGVTDMHQMFQESSFNQDISGWTTSAVLRMDDMFNSNIVFNQPIGSWSVVNVQDMGGMFYGASSFNQDLSGWSTGSVTDMNYMFGASAFDQNIGSWDVSAVTNMANMFADGAGLSTANYDALLNGWIVQSLQSFVVFDAGTSQYSLASASAHNDELGFPFYFWTITDGGFVSCSVCSQLCSPCGGGCTATDLTSMFDGVTNFDNVVGDITTWNTSCVTSMLGLFTGSDFNQDISGWDVSGVTSMSTMFASSAFNQNISGWDTSSVNNMGGMFQNNGVFNNDISSWDTSSVTDMTMMFENAYAFNQDISGWVVSNVGGMSNMFAGASSFNQDIGSWNTVTVSDMSGMFNGASAFNQNLSLWNVATVMSVQEMFNGVTLSTPNYDSLLNGWASQLVQSGLELNAGLSQYSSAGLSARNDTLIGVYGWTITDGGMVFVPVVGNQSIVDLGLSHNFSLFGVSAISDATPASSSITGDVGVNPVAGSFITGVSCSNIVGRIFENNAGYTGGFDSNVSCAIVNASYVLDVESAMEVAYNDARDRTLPDHTELGSGEIGGLTLYAGLYKWSTPIAISNDVVLDCLGDSNAVFIFQSSLSLSLANGKRVNLTGGCQASNIFWQVDTSATLGTTSVFEGTILAGTAITINSGATLNGRAFAQTAVTLDGNVVTLPVYFAPCIPSWSCSLFDNCSISNISACLAVTDSNICGGLFGGNLSTYDEACIYSPSCIENWTQQLPMACDGLLSNFTVLYVDFNSCNTTIDLPINNGSVTTCCVESWIPSYNPLACSWGNVTERLLTYSDFNTCGTNFTLPVDNNTLVGCNCTELWVAHNTTCTGTHTLYYTDAHICGTTVDLPLDNGTITSCTILYAGGGSGGSPYIRPQSALITGNVVTPVTSTFSIGTFFKNFFTGIIDWFRNLFGFLGG